MSHGAPSAAGAETRRAKPLGRADRRETGGAAAMLRAAPTVQWYAHGVRGARGIDLAVSDERGNFVVVDEGKLMPEAACAFAPSNSSNLDGRSSRAPPRHHALAR